MPFFLVIVIVIVNYPALRVTLSCCLVAILFPIICIPQWLFTINILEKIQMNSENKEQWRRTFHNAINSRIEEDWRRDKWSIKT